MPLLKPFNVRRQAAQRCGPLVLAAAALTLSPSLAGASDILLSGTPFAALDVIGSRREAHRSSAAQDPERTVLAAYARDTGREAAIDAVPGVALASRPPASLSKTETRAWVSGYSLSSRTGADRSAPALKSHGGGFTAGIDRLLDPTLLAGVSVGFSHIETASPGLRKDFDTFSGGAYVSWAPFDGWELDGFLGNTWVEMDSARALSVDGMALPTEGRSRGLGLTAAASGGYRFRSTTSIGEAFAKPFTSLAYVSQRRRAYEESGSFGMGLVFPSETFERATLNLGLATGIEMNAGQDWTIRPELRLAWSRYLSDPSPQIPAFLFGAPVVVSDPDPGRDGAVVALEVTGWRKRELQAFAGYTGEFRPNATVHQGRGGLRLTW